MNTDYHFDFDSIVPHPEGYGDATFIRTDKRSVVVHNVRVDSIGPCAEQPGVVAAETLMGDLVHLPFVESWLIDYIV